MERSVVRVRLRELRRTSVRGSTGSPTIAQRPRRRQAPRRRARTRRGRGTSANGRRHSGESPMSAASRTPPSASAASQSRPLSGPTSNCAGRSARSAMRAACRADPGSTTARCTPAGQYGRAARSASAPRADVVACDAVAEVDDARARAAARDHRVADADEFVARAVIRQEGDQRPAIAAQRRPTLGAARRRRSPRRARRCRGATPRRGARGRARAASRSSPGRSRRRACREAPRPRRGRRGRSARSRMT